MTSLKVDKKIFLKRLFFYHLVLSTTYYLYALFNPSDSITYYSKVNTSVKGDAWFDYYGTSTTFIEWVGFPFIKYLGFNYEAMMALFALFGFIGFLLFYTFFYEKQRTEVKLYGYNLLHLFFLLPNLHFWSASFGKGALIFMGIGLFFYSLNNPLKRWSGLLVGGLIVYHVRPHVMMVILVALLIGFVFSTKGLSLGLKFLMIVLASSALFFIYSDILTLVGIDQGQELTQGLNLSHRASELTKATSGVDITNYSLPLQLFTFLYRPLFFDAPGLLGLIVSFENVFLLLITLYFIFKGGLKYIFISNFLVKTAFFSFIAVSIALAQIAGNLGLAIRQKSQVMLLFLFVILRYLDEKQVKELQKQWFKMRKEKLRKLRMKAMQQP